MTTLYFTPAAEEQAARIDLDWRTHAQTNPQLFSEELLWAQKKAVKMRSIYQVYRWVRGVAVRRVYMPRAKHHLYYLYEEENDRVVVVAVWGAKRRTGPAL